MRKLGRRQFLTSVGGFGALAGLSSAWFLRANRKHSKEWTSGDIQDVAEYRSVSSSSWALGSTVSMTVFHRDQAQAHRAIEAAFVELRLIDDLMSIYRPRSQVSRLNRDRILDDPHPHLLKVLQTARHVSERTSGAFDITIQPLWELYATSKDCRAVPTDSEIEAARTLVDWQRVAIGSGHVRLLGRGTKITLNGIAQGFAADRVVEVLRRYDIEHALIDTGEVGALGLKPDNSGWTIGIQHPRDEEAYISLANLAGRCLATSGDYATTFSSDYRSHHLFDPRTGHSPLELSSVSIAAPTAVEADALSTAVFVMGLDAGSALISETNGADAMLVSKDGRTLMTEGFPVA